MNYKNTVINQIKHKETEIIPYTLGFQRESRDRLDGYYGNGDWRKLIKPYINRVWTMDCQQKIKINDLYSRDIYGSIWREENLMAHLEKPVLIEPSIKNYVFPKADDFFTKVEHSLTSKNLQQSNNSFSIIHIPWGLFEKSWSLRGFENVLLDMSLNQKFYEKLINKITEHLVGFVEIAVQYPVDAIMFGDDWGGQTGLFMGRDRWRSIFKHNYKKLYDRVHKSGKFVISHCCGNIVDILPDLVEIGLDVYESVQPEAMDVYKVKEEFGRDITFWGGLGAQSLIPFGTPEDIKKEVNKLNSKLAKGGGFILAPSKDPPPETPIENLIALIDYFTKV